MKRGTSPSFADGRSANPIPNFEHEEVTSDAHTPEGEFDDWLDDIDSLIGRTDNRYSLDQSTKRHRSQLVTSGTHIPAESYEPTLGPDSFDWLNDIDSTATHVDQRFPAAAAADQSEEIISTPLHTAALPPPTETTSDLSMVVYQTPRTNKRAGRELASDTPASLKKTKPDANQIRTRATQKKRPSSVSKSDEIDAPSQLVLAQTPARNRTSPLEPSTKKHQQEYRSPSVGTSPILIDFETVRSPPALLDRTSPPNIRPSGPSAEIPSGLDMAVHHTPGMRTNKRPVDEVDAPHGGAFQLVLAQTPVRDSTPPLEPSSKKYQQEPRSQSVGTTPSPSDQTETAWGPLVLQDSLSQTRASTLRSPSVGTIPSPIDQTVQAPLDLRDFNDFGHEGVNQDHIIDQDQIPAPLGPGEQDNVNQNQIPAPPGPGVQHVEHEDHAEQQQQPLGCEDGRAWAPALDALLERVPADLNVPLSSDHARQVFDDHADLDAQIHAFWLAMLHCPNVETASVPALARIVRTCLGFQPVAATAPMQNTLGNPDLTPNGYISHLLQWATQADVQLDVARRVLVPILFGVQTAPEYDTLKQAIGEFTRENVRRNCTDRMQPTAIAQHGTVVNFNRRYLTRMPVHNVNDDVFVWRVPRYDARQLVAAFSPHTLVPPARIKALQSGFTRAEYHFTIRAAVLLYAGLLQLLGFVLHTNPEVLPAADIPMLWSRALSIPFDAAAANLPDVINEICTSLLTLRDFTVVDENVDDVPPCAHAWTEGVLNAYANAVAAPAAQFQIPDHFTRQLVRRVRAEPEFAQFEAADARRFAQRATPQHVQDMIGFQPVAQKHKFDTAQGGEYMPQLFQWAALHMPQFFILYAYTVNHGVHMQTLDAARRDVIDHNCMDRMHIVQRIRAKRARAVASNSTTTFPQYLTKRPRSFVPVDADAVGGAGGPAPPAAPIASMEWTLPRFRVPHDGRIGEIGMSEHAMDATEHAFTRKKYLAQNEEFILLFFKETQAARQWLTNQPHQWANNFHAIIQQVGNVGIAAEDVQSQLLLQVFKQWASIPIDEDI